MRRIVLAALLLTVLGASPGAAQDLWYRNYEYGLRAIERSDWQEAISRLGRSIEQREEPSRNARTYRMRFISYFPYYYLGIVHYSMGDKEEARRYFERERDFGEILRDDEMGGQLETLLTAAVGMQAPEAVVQQAEETVQAGLEAKLTQGISELGEGRFRQALSMFAAVVAVDPANVRASEFLEQARTQALQQELAQISQRTPELITPAVMSQLSAFGEIAALAPPPPPPAEVEEEPAPAEPEPTPVVETPPAEPEPTPVVETPPAEPTPTPVVETPPAEPAPTPVVETPPAEPEPTPVVETPAAEPEPTPVVEVPPAEPEPTPVETPPAEPEPTPIEEAPVAAPAEETPVADASAEVASRIETVAWTILRDGQRMADDGDLEGAAAKYLSVITMMEMVDAQGVLADNARAHHAAVQAEILRLSDVKRDEEIALLRSELEELRERDFRLAVTSPPDFDEPFEEPVLRVAGVALDEAGVVDVEVEVNGQVWDRPSLGRGMAGTRGIKVSARTDSASTLGRQVDFEQTVTLEEGDNDIVVRARNVQGRVVETHRRVRHAPKERNVYAAVIGISQYTNTTIPDLDYAAADARSFYEHLRTGMGVPEENISLLLDADATRERMMRVLGQELRERAEEQDMVIIYYAGHGAPEEDVNDPDGDGAEKYLVPTDADPGGLFSTAVAMNTISQVFGRIRAQTIVFVADACYSGAAGGDGRTFGTSGSGGRISGNYIRRLEGSGRLILTASTGNQLSHERSDLGHGVFTYFLVEGLQGAADQDGDGAITVNEAYAYVSRRVADETQNKQNPMLTGSIGGRIFLSAPPDA